MTINPLISIIIPCYNYGQYIQEAIKSVEDSTCNNYEIIIINDGSTQLETQRILKELELKGYNIINQRNLGLAKARNNGIKLAKGKYIIPLDADNKIRPEFINKSIDFFQKNEQYDIYYGNAMYFGEREGIWVVKKFSFLDLIVENYIDACACFRRSVWEKINGYDENMPIMGFEDWDFWLRLSLSGCQFHHESQILFEYRVSNESMISNTAKHKEILISYIFSKNELRNLSNIREEYLGVQNTLKELKKRNIEKVKYHFLFKEIKNRFLKFIFK